MGNLRINRGGAKRIIKMDAAGLMLKRHRLFAHCSACIALPVSLVAWVAMKPAVQRLHDDVLNVINGLGSECDEIWASYADLLVIAEDHRFYLHQGVDIVGIARAAVQSIVGTRLQGGSTIEQQLVRTITGRREVSLRRKLREVILACSLRRNFTKSEVLLAYLQVAYFGDSIIGIAGAIRLIDVPTVALGVAPAYRVAHLLHPSCKSEAESLTVRRLMRAFRIGAKLRRAQNSDHVSLLPTSRGRTANAGTQTEAALRER